MKAIQHESKPVKKLKTEQDRKNEASQLTGRARKIKYTRS